MVGVIYCNTDLFLSKNGFMIPSQNDIEPLIVHSSTVQFHWVELIIDILFYNFTLFFHAQKLWSNITATSGHK